jgi:DNA-binding LytR/AlgR family response regulator
MLNYLIADDERLARDVIATHAAKVERLHLVATCANGLEVVNALRAQPVDLMFLDLQMPQFTGVELLRTLKALPPVIVTTAHQEFAVEGYELNVLDYLLKPVSFDRFLKALDKYEQWGKAVPRSQAQNQGTDHALRSKPFLYIKSEKKMLKVFFEDILYVEGLKDYVRVNTREKSIITHQTLAYFEEKLAADQFLRVHRSFIVSHRHITAYSATEIEVGAACLPIGSSYARTVFQLLQA